MSLEQHAPTAQVVERDYSLDFLRGFAILLMIITHVIAILYEGGSETLGFIGILGGTICFTLFLFVFSAVLGLKASKEKIDARTEIYRSIKFLIAYYIISLWVYIFFYRGLENETHDITKDLWDILVFWSLPEYVEFIFAFVANIWLVVGLYKYGYGLFKRPAAVITSAIALYFLGRFAYTTHLSPEYLNVLKGHLMGHQEVHFFGILSYIPVLSIGLMWGFHLLKATEQVRTKFAAGSFVVSFGLYHLLAYSPLDAVSRWPPTPRFLLYGLCYIFAVLTLFPLLKKITPLYKMVMFVGQAAFEYFTYHVLIIMLMYYLVEGERMNGTISMAIFVGIMLGMTGLVLLKKEIDRRYNQNF